MYLSSNPYTKLLEIEHPRDGLTVGATYLLNAFVSITPFVPKYPKLSGLEETPFHYFSPFCPPRIRTANSRILAPGGICWGWSTQDTFYTHQSGVPAGMPWSSPGWADMPTTG